MNVLFLSELFYPHGSGAELATYLYARLLSEANLNVVVVTNRLPSDLEVSRKENPAIYRLPLFKAGGSVKYSILQRFDVLLSSFMRRMVKWADVVYIPRLWYSAIPLAKAYGKPVILHLHDYIPICPISNLYDIAKGAICNHHGLLCPPTCVYVFEKNQGRGFTGTITSTALNSTFGRYLGKSVRLSDAIICVSNAQRNIIVNRMRSLSKKTHVIHNPAPEYSRVGIEGDDFGYFGGPSSLKGFNSLCYAMRHTYCTNHKVVNIHATKFPGLVGHLAAFLGSLGFILHGKLNSDQFMELYRNIRAVIVPSIWPEPWPYVVVEAILRGRFVIASNIGGIPEQVEGCEATILCETGDHKRLAEAIESVRGLSRETVDDLGLKNRDAFLKRFSNEATIREFISVCEHLT